MQGWAGSPHSSRLEESSANYLTIIIMTMTTARWEQVLGANKAKDKKVVVSSESSAETASPLGHQGVLVQRPASLDLLISLVNLVIRHSAPTLRSPGSWFGLEENNHLPGTD